MIVVVVGERGDNTGSIYTRMLETVWVSKRRG